MKTSGLQYLLGCIFLLFLRNSNAQNVTEQIRNSDTISYFVSVPYNNYAEFTWTITGGSIIGHFSPYTSIGADTILVIWNNSNKNSANQGSLKVFERISWSGAEYCQSEETAINVESWVQPAAIVDNNDITVCSNDPFLISVRFQGMPDYRFKWKLYNKENPDELLEDHTAYLISCADSTYNIIINGIENNTDSVKTFFFEITDVQDGLNDNCPGNISQGSANILVQPIPHTGILQSSKHLKRRL